MLLCQLASHLCPELIQFCCGLSKEASPVAVLCHGPYVLVLWGCLLPLNFLKLFPLFFLQLTSRLTNDVAAMSEPINWQLSALMRNAVALIGGILLCFLTSWKLSILAFVTMAPILHITAVYSRWSRDLNRSRYAVSLTASHQLVTTIELAIQFLPNLA